MGAIPGTICDRQIRINVLGDSISYGDRLKDRSKAYPYILSGKAGADCLNNYSICGICITGSVPYSFLDRYPEMDRNADLVLVFGGTNDYGVLERTDLGNIKQTRYYKNTKNGGYYVDQIRLPPAFPSFGG